MSNDSFVFHFDLRESLYLEGNQGISEIINIALDPEISIQEFNDYYSIRGVISLNGEHVQTEVNHEGVTSSLNEYDFKRYMEKNEDLGEGLGEFAHRFPVEISIPSYRVADVDDVKVSIASFDYELPSPQKLIINATIGIQGIEDDPTTPEREESPVELTGEEENMEEEEILGSIQEKVEEENRDTFEFEVVKKKDDEYERETVQSSDSSELPHADTEIEVEEETEGPERLDKKEEKSEEDRLLFKKKTQSLQEFFATKQDNNKKEDTSNVQDAPTEHVEQKEDAQGVVSDVNAAEEVENNEEERKQTEGMDVSFLSDMIRNNEETYTQMRLCIVQKDDTIESIAERYKTTSLHIIKRNQLEDDAVSEGQLLYVPLKNKSK
ncbi:stage VI sporulation protein D [Cerasibacillus terrae]|uniref:stage VI sporulation protein D n=1 Tax=Cerasibacillus terrae TaxID=2498845 RepID=UPI001746FB56|nr:stage VI sporulation protein D [Cerasibacillus terrae]